MKNRYDIPEASLSLFSVLDFSPVMEKYDGKRVTRRDEEGFYEDYAVVDYLIHELKLENFFEIGTSKGVGTFVICVAMGLPMCSEKKVFSIDLPPQDRKLTDEDLGSANPIPFKQILGDTKEFDFSPYYPIDGWFIDGGDSYEHVSNDTKKALESNPVIIIYNNLEKQQSRDAVVDAFLENKKYNIYYAMDTRIGFALRGRIQEPLR